MKFLMVNTVFPPDFSRGGPPRVNFNLAKALSEHDQEVTVLTSTSKSFLGAKIKKKYSRFSVVYLPVLGLIPKYYFSPGLIKEIFSRRKDFDVCLIRGQWTFYSIAAALVCRFIKKPFIVYPEGCLEPWALEYHCLKKRIYWQFIERYVYKWSKGIIALSEAEAVQVRKTGIIKSTKAIPNGINPGELFLSKEQKEKYLSSDLKDKKIILFFGRIHPKKGLDLLVEAFYRVHKVFPDTVLVVAGPQEDAVYASRVKSLVEKLELGDMVKFVGMLIGKKRLAILNSACVFVLPSYSEGLPLAVLEAAACRVPVIITPACNLPEFITGGAGISIDISSRSIFEAICSVLKDEDNRYRMAEEAFRIVQEQFDWRSIAKRTKEFCSLAVKNN